MDNHTRQTFVAGLVGVVMATTPMTALAQSATSPAEFFPVLENVNFSSEQQSQLTQLRQQTRSQLETIVSSEQRQRFRQALTRGDGLWAAISVMQLSPDQRGQVRQVLRSSRQQLASIVTPAQRQQILQNLRQQWGYGSARFQP